MLGWVGEKMELCGDAGDGPSLQTKRVRMVEAELPGPSEHQSQDHSTGGPCLS